MCPILMSVYIIVNIYNGKSVWTTHIGPGFHCEALLIEERGTSWQGSYKQRGVSIFQYFSAIASQFTDESYRKLFRCIVISNKNEKLFLLKLSYSNKCLSQSKLKKLYIFNYTTPTLGHSIECPYLLPSLSLYGCN